MTCYDWVDSIDESKIKFDKFNNLFQANILFFPQVIFFSAHISSIEIRSQKQGMFGVK